MFLVDTSVWIEVFKARNPLRLEALCDFDSVVTCLPIVQEVLQGFREEGTFRWAREALRALPTVEAPLKREVFEEAADLYRDTRRVGLTVRSSVDCLIATCALRHGLTVLHRDRDYALLTRVCALREQDVRTSSGASQ